MRARVVSALLMVLALAVTAHAQSRREAAPLERILPEIRRSTPGTFYDAEGPFMSPDGRLVYRVKWMTPDGRIVWFEADGRTGRVMRYGPSRPSSDYPHSQRRDWGQRDDADRRDRGDWDREDHRDRGGWDRGRHGDWSRGDHPRRNR